MAMANDSADKDWVARIGEDDLEEMFSSVSTLALKVTFTFVIFQVLRHLDDIIPIIFNNSPLGS